MSRKKHQTPSKVCLECKLEFVRKAREGVSRFPYRKYCSIKCASIARERLPDKICVGCGIVFNPKRRRGKYCSKSCFGKSRIVDSPKRRRYVKRGLRHEHRVVMEEMLGRMLKLHESVHHKNGNTTDNRPQNLELWTRGQPAGQRVADIIDFVIKEYRELVIEALNEQSLQQAA